MQRFAKKIFIIAGIVGGILALVLLIINMYLQSSSVQERIHSATAQVFGKPIKLKSTTYTPWGGLVLRGISLPDSLTPNLNTFEVNALRVRFTWLPLLQNRFVVSEITLFSPVAHIRQMEDGSWLLPMPVPGKIETPAVPEMHEAPPSSTPKAPSYKLEIKRVRVRDGGANFIDTKGQLILSINNANIDTKLTAENGLKGKYNIESIQLVRSLMPRKVQGGFTFDGSTLDLPEITGDLGGGTLNAHYRIKDLKDEPRFLLNLSCNKAELEKLIEDAGVSSGDGTHGVANGTMVLQGDPRNTATFTGSGHIDLLEAKMRPIDFIRQIGDVLRIDELQMLELETARAGFTIKNERIDLKNVSLKSENLILTGEGPIRFDGRIKINARLLVNQKLQKQLRGVLSKNFIPSEDPEYHQLTFRVTGEIDNPKTDLFDRLIGIKLGRDVKGLFHNFFHSSQGDEGGAKEKNNKPVQ